MKRIITFSYIFFTTFTIQAQGINGNVRIGLLTSVYLDSAFDANGNYRLQKNFPKIAAGGLEFYEGASLAIDSLNKLGYLATMKVIDLQSKERNIKSLAQSGELDNLNILISYSGSVEYLELAAIAKEKNLTLINANYPNDGGVRNSPTIFISNPEINSHLTALYNQLSKKWPDAKITWYKRSDVGDDRLYTIFNDQGNNSRKINIQTITLPNNFTANDVTSSIDSTKLNVLIAGSIDDGFSTQFCKAILTYPKKGIIHVVGMPNWEGLKEIQNKAYASIPIYFTSGFFAQPGNKWLTDYDMIFKENTGTKASLSAIRGFELTYFFGSLWAKKGIIDPKDFSEPELRIITDYDFRPVYWNSENVNPDYFENKRIYFIRKLNGVVTVQ